MDQTMRLRPRRSLDGVQAVDKSTRKNDRVLVSLIFVHLEYSNSIDWAS